MILYIYIYRGFHDIVHIYIYIYTGFYDFSWEYGHIYIYIWNVKQYHMGKTCSLLWMKKILHQLVDGLAHYNLMIV